MRKLFLIIFAVTILVPLLISVSSIFSGSIPFWFDPARDFLQALSNQSKLSLIGQPTGIPGLFYGPYWIWLLSFALYVSKDPRIVQFLVLALPYFMFFPLILFSLKKSFGLISVIVLWTLFIFGFLRYTIFPWNPHLAPLLVLAVFYLLMTKGKEISRSSLIKAGLAGFLAGLIGNFHISFAIGLLIGIFLFFVVSFFIKPDFKNLKKLFLEGVTFFSGLILVFIPFILFEARHGFNQTKVVLETVLSPYAVVGIKGLGDDQIIQRFFQVFSDLLAIPKLPAVLLIGIPLAILIVRFATKKLSLSIEEKAVLILSISTLASILFVYLTSKNPVWEYHFIAVEVILLFLIGLIMKKFVVMRIVFLVLAIIIFAGNLFTYIFSEKPSVLSFDTLAKKEYIVKAIHNDSNGKDYTVFAYNPGIYSYEYSYLFNWIAQKDVPYDPGQIERGGDLVYLIIQKTTPGIYQDYINAHAPEDSYKTTKRWDLPDGTVVLKREALKKDI